MLQIIFFTILISVGMVLVPEGRSAPVKAFFDGANEIVLKVVDIIMLMAPFGVFALISTLIVESPSADIFLALGVYGMTVVLGLMIILFVIYPFLIKFWGGMDPVTFYRKLAPEQLVAFS